METQSTDASTGDGGGDADASAETAGESGNVDGLKKALERERKSRRDAEKRVKDLEPFEKQVNDLNESSKTELQKLTDALNTEKSGRTSAETALLRFTTAADKGVPLNLVRFLSGTTAEEIAESAELLLKELGAKPAVPGKPREAQRLSTGRPSDHEGTDDPLELIKIARNQRA